MNFDFVTENIAVGTFPENQKDVDQLKAAGITHVLNVREFDDINEAKVAFEYLWNPTADWTPQAVLGLEPKPEEWFAVSLTFWYPGGVPAPNEVTSKLFCHCSAGVNRSATTAWMLLRAMQIKAADCSVIVDTNRPWAAVGLVLDKTWRKDAEKALQQLGYIS